MPQPGDRVHAIPAPAPSRGLPFARTAFPRTRAVRVRPVLPLNGRQSRALVVHGDGAGPVPTPGTSAQRSYDSMTFSQATSSLLPRTDAADGGARPTPT